MLGESADAPAGGYNLAGEDDAENGVSWPRETEGYSRNQALQGPQGGREGANEAIGRGDRGRVDANEHVSVPGTGIATSASCRTSRGP